MDTIIWNPAALLLDLDGTVANSLSVMRLVYSRFLESFDATSTMEEFNSLNGPPLFEIIGRLKEAHGLPGSVKDLHDHYSALIDEAYACVTPNSGAEILLRQARVNDCRVGIVTSNSANRTWLWLKRVDLSDFVNFVIAGEDVIRGKPDPAPYRVAALRTDRRLDRIAAVDDSPVGARSASEAGLRTFGLDPVGGSHYLWPLGVETVRSLDDLAARLW